MIRPKVGLERQPFNPRKLLCLGYLTIDSPGTGEWKIILGMWPVPHPIGIFKR